MQVHRASELQNGTILAVPIPADHDLGEGAVLFDGSTALTNSF